MRNTIVSMKHNTNVPTLHQLKGSYMIISTTTHIKLTVVNAENIIAIIMCKYPKSSFIVLSIKLNKIFQKDYMPKTLYLD